MAEVYGNAYAALTTGFQEIYRCPVGTSSIVLMCQVANTDGVADVLADVSWIHREGAVATRVYLGKAIEVPVGAAIGLLDGRLILGEDDSIEARVDLGAADVTVSFIEVS